ncbi:MAG: hypothetical protein RLZZ230_277 [Candidatus Parcubacteria bacterium]|jgi:RND family efflux transporter MFP subunit
MKIIFGNRKLYITIALVIIALVLTMTYFITNQKPPELVTTTVETGPVRQLVSVSGIAEAEQTAELAFPVVGTVRDVLVAVGDVVAVGDTLVTIDARTLYADRQDALAAITQAVATRDELVNGPTASARTVTGETIESKQKALETTRESEAQKVINTYRTLLSSNLTAYSKDATEDAMPPTISGTYACDEEGVYKIEMYSSSAESGYSYKLSGIETGTFTTSTVQPIPMGNCGIRIQFDPNSNYNRSVWYIDIPNTKSITYVTNRNAHALAITQAESAITLAAQAVTLAQADAQNQNAPARSEAITRANASISQAQARLHRIDATIADRALVAPFAGTITEVSVLPGETVTTAPIITLLANDIYKITARIPEIDIGKLVEGQAVEMMFDARVGEIVLGDVAFISPQATEIDGVSYYEAIIRFQELPSWMRSGLNADIDIIINEESNSLRVPKRFITTNDTGYEVLRKDGETIASTTVQVILEGNDGFMAITGLTAGDTLVAP